MEAPNFALIHEQLGVGQRRLHLPDMLVSGSHGSTSTTWNTSAPAGPQDGDPSELHGPRLCLDPLDPPDMFSHLVRKTTLPLSLSPAPKATSSLLSWLPIKLCQAQLDELMRRCYWLLCWMIFLLWLVDDSAAAPFLYVKIGHQKECRRTPNVLKTGIGVDIQTLPYLLHQIFV